MVLVGIMEHGLKPLPQAPVTLGAEARGSVLKHALR